MNQPSTPLLDARFAFDPTAGDFPFNVELSLEPLIRFWQQTMTDQHPMKQAVNHKIQPALRQSPALLDPIEDVAIMAAHKQLVDMLMTAVFPPASWDGAYGAILVPFLMQSVYATPSFERLLLTPDGYLKGRVDSDRQAVSQIRLLHTYAFVLHMVHGLEIDFDYPLIFTASDPDTGLDRHFRMNFDGRFVSVKALSEVKPLTESQKERLLANLANTDVLMELIPPDQFIIQGFMVINAIEVTDQEVLSSLKRDLIEKESIISNDRLSSLQTKLRTLFRKPNLMFGLAAIDGDQVMVLNYGSNIEYG